MTSHSRRQYQATIRAAHPADLAYYRRVLADCTEYPFAGEGSTPLSRAVWALEIDKTKPGREPMKFKYDPKVISTYLNVSCMTVARLAELCHVSAPSVYMAKQGKAGSAAAAKIINYINLHPVKERPAAPSTGAVQVSTERVKQIVAEEMRPSLTRASVDKAVASDSLQWLREVIDAGKVKSIEIRMEVGE